MSALYRVFFSILANVSPLSFAREIIIKGNVLILLNIQMVKYLGILPFGNF